MDERLEQYFKIGLCLYRFTKIFFWKIFVQYVTVWLVQIWRYKNTGKKEHTFSWKKKVQKTNEKRLLCNRGGVEKQRLRPRPRTQKNPRPRLRTDFPRTDPLEAKNRIARGQGPRTQRTSVVRKKVFAQKLQIFRKFLAF